MTKEPDNKRETFRIHSELEAIIRLRDKKCVVKITDISSGGLKIVTNHVFPVGEYISVDFMVYSERVITLCQIVNIFQRSETQNVYGLKYDYVTEPDLKKIRSFIFDAEAMSKWI